MIESVQLLHAHAWIIQSSKSKSKSKFMSELQKEIIHRHKEMHTRT